MQRFQCSFPIVSKSFTPSSIVLAKRLNCSHFCSLKVTRQQMNLLPARFPIREVTQRWAVGLTLQSGPGLAVPQALSWRKSWLRRSRLFLLFSFLFSSPVIQIYNKMLGQKQRVCLKIYSNSLNSRKGTEKNRLINSYIFIYLLIFVGEKQLEDFTAGDNRMPAHSRHPTLKPLHAHFYKFLFKST